MTKFGASSPLYCWVCLCVCARVVVIKYDPSGCTSSCVRVRVRVLATEFRSKHWDTYFRAKSSSINFVLYMVWAKNRDTSPGSESFLHNFPKHVPELRSLALSTCRRLCHDRWRRWRWNICFCSGENGGNFRSRVLSRLGAKFGQFVQLIV